MTALLLVGIRHHIGYLQRSRSRTLRIWEHMQLRHVEPTEKLVCVLKAFRRLATASHHHIHTDKGIGHHRLDTPYLVGKELAVVMPVHKSQHLVASALQRYVEMWHKRTALRTEVDELIAYQVGLQTAYSVSADALHLVESAHEVDKSLTGGLTEVADVHSRQHNLLPPLCSSLLGLRHKRVDRGITTKPSGKGDCTVCAEIVATVLHLQEISRPSASRTARRKSAYILCLHRIILVKMSIDIHSPFLRQKLYKVCLLVGTQH